jgi:DNA-binding NarL/FixJ family response regulator
LTGENPLVDDTNRRIVQMLADGYRQREIAAKVALSLSAVRRRIEKLRLRVGASTSAHLVALALRRGWIK